MKRIVVLFLIVAMVYRAVPVQAEPVQAAGLDEVLAITSFDGVTFEGRLRMPGAEGANRLVIFVNGSGPNTYDNRRSAGEGKEFNYHDLFANELNKRGAAYFSYNTRGVTPGDEPPLYCQIDEALYQTYKPTNEIKDMACIIEQLKALEPLKDAEVTLLGWSAGAIVAPQTALANEGLVDMLVLAGYPNDTMAEILDWQQTGGASMVFYRQYFDTDGDGAISQDEYEADPYQLRAMLGDSGFAELDLNADGMLTTVDFGRLLKENRDAVFAAFENGDDEWLKQNYPVRLTSEWYLDYANIEPNSTALPKLDIPIHILQGTYDHNTPFEGAKAVEETFLEMGKDNLSVHIYSADHDLNYLQYVVTGTIPDAINDLLDACAAGLK